MKTVRKQKALVAAVLASTMILGACGQAGGGEDSPQGGDTESQGSANDGRGVGDVAVPAAAEERGYYHLDEWWEAAPDDQARHDAFMQLVQADAEASNLESDEPLKIAFLFPSLELSDAWGRLGLAITGRLDDLGIEYETTEFLIRPDEHDRQATQIEQIIAEADKWDYVVVGPSEYTAQKRNLERLAEAVPTLVQNIVNPFTDITPGSEPITHVGFDHSVGAQALCEWTIEQTGGEGEFALLRYVPGLVDELRSDVFAECLEENSNMTLVGDYEAEGDTDQAYTGTNALIGANPDIAMLHSGSTAVSLGALAGLRERGMLDDVIVNGWGGGQDELDAIIKGDLDVTAFRVNDDWGVSVAEAIRLHAEGRQDEIPYVIAATIETVDKSMSAEEIEAKTDYAFRYSGDIDR
ncbi:substrate-binding domain-containing protein [Georgenia daeguensis]